MPLHIFLHDELAATFDYPRGARYHGEAGECVRGLVGAPRDGAGPARWAAGIIAAVLALDGVRAVGAGLGDLEDFALEGCALAAAGDLAAREEAVALALARYAALAGAAPAARLSAARAVLAEAQALVALLEALALVALAWLPLRWGNLMDIAPWL